MTITLFNVCHVTTTDFKVCHVTITDFEVCHVTRIHTSLKLDVYHTYKLPDHYKACYIIIRFLGYTYHVCILQIKKNAQYISELTFSLPFDGVLLFMIIAGIIFSPVI